MVRFAKEPTGPGIVVDRRPKPTGATQRAAARKRMAAAPPKKRVGPAYKAYRGQGFNMPGPKNPTQ